MKKKDSFNLLVDIAPLLEDFLSTIRNDHEIEQIKEVFQDTFEIWKYSYDPEKKSYAVDKCIVPDYFCYLPSDFMSRSARRCDLHARFMQDDRVRRVLAWNYGQPHSRETEKIRHFQSRSTAQLMSSIEGLDLFELKKK